MTYSELFDNIDKPKRKRRRRKPQKQTVLWTVYHTILALELLVIIIIEGIELFYGCLLYTSPSPRDRG